MKVETQDNGKANGFRFRLVAGDGRASGWAGYTQIAVLDDKMAFTMYYACHEARALVPLDFKTGLLDFAVGEEGVAQ
jgi:hypothetical protein